MTEAKPKPRRKFLRRLQAFFFPPAGSTLRTRLLPYITLGVITLLVFIFGGAAWEYTNSPQFCGTVCHTMPPEYTSYLTSPHARVACVECHIGRGFIATQVSRKSGDIKHIISLAFKSYEFPITADEMRPARESCEKCHFPEKFSDDSLREFKRYADDVENSPYSIYMIFKTGGGAKRLGLGRGIHWHIENQVFFYPTDDFEQVIPYVRVVNDDGSITEYIDTESDFTPADIDDAELKQMDCITCHNRITHLVPYPEETVDQLISRELISESIPEIRSKAAEVFSRLYDTTELGLIGITGLEGYYQVVYPEFYSENKGLIDQAISALQEAYANSVYPEESSDWTSHPNNVGHKNSPGCFRCHDGTHLSSEGEAVRLECNICHSIPVTAGASDFVSEIEISRGPEPSSHLNPNWINLHHDAFDVTCANCHTTDDAGGVSNTSFCSNSQCHGVEWVYAGFDAPSLREILRSQLPTPEPTEAMIDEGPLTYGATILPIFEVRCGACHGEDGIQGLNLLTYPSALEGSVSGAVIQPGDPEASLLIQKQTGDQPHFGQFTASELELVREWIDAGATP